MRSAAGRAAWRASSIVVSAILLIVLTPLLALIAARDPARTRPGPCCFASERLGRDRKPFMRQQVPHDAQRRRPRARTASSSLGLIAGEHPERARGRPPLQDADDERVTRVGRLLRRSSLDELPQLWNVLRGECRSSGPVRRFPTRSSTTPPHWFARFAVKPGLTGLWQVSGRSELTLEEMVALDIEYIHAPIAVAQRRDPRAHRAGGAQHAGAS